MLFQRYLLARKQSLLRLFLYTSPAPNVSVAYMDPGNYGTDIAGGASLNYSLLWVVWLSRASIFIWQDRNSNRTVVTRNNPWKTKKENIHHTVLASG